MDEISTVFKNTVEDAFAYALGDIQQMNTTKGTLFEAYNAVTGLQNVRSSKDSESDTIHYFGLKLLN
jgi:hypothetical protein